MKITEAISLCLEEGRARKRLSAGTLKGYRYLCNTFCRFVGADTEASDLTTKCITDHLRRLETGKEDGGAGCAPRSIRCHWHAIAYLCHWLTEKGHVVGNPMPSHEDFPFPKMKEPLRRTTPQSMVADLLTATKKLDLVNRARARVILYLLNCSAIRNCELRNLRCQDINLSTGRMDVLSGKGGKTRTLFLPSDCVDAVKEWLRYRPMNAKHDYLLTVAGGRYEGISLSTCSIRKILRDLCGLAGISQPLDALPHAMRRGTASRLIQSGFDIDAVRTVLGHSSLATTQMYISTSADRLKQLAHLSALAPAADAVPTPAPRAAPSLKLEATQPPPTPDPQSPVRKKKSKAPRVPLWEQQQLLRRIQREQKGGVV